MEVENTATQGSGKEGFIPVSSEEQGKTQSAKEESGDKFGLKFLPVVLKSLEENLSFTTVLLGIIGYIIIASLGHMSNLFSYFGYAFFLILSFLTYWFFRKTKLEINYDFKNAKLLLIFIVLYIVTIILLRPVLIIGILDFLINILVTIRNGFR